MNDPIVGIDLGTSNSVVAHADAAGAVKVLADEGGAKVHPSVVSFHPNGGVVVGAAAKQRKVIDPANTIYSIKRLIGRAYRSTEVQTAKSRSPFQIKEGTNQAPVIATRAGEFAVPEISAIVLDHVRNIAAARLDAPVNRAVVTVPASFNDAQRSATATAGAIAGLTVVRVLNEPTAAALAYGHTRNLREIIAVYDFGGGTFDLTLLKLEDQVYEVLGTAGDSFLGGDDLDERLVDKMVAKFLVENRIDLRTNEVSMMRLRAVAEQTKIELSRRSRAVVRIDEIAYGARGVPLNLQIEISRDEFVREVADLIERTFPVCTEALALANLSIDRVADVILVGGTTKIPYVRDLVGRYFGKLPRADVNPEDAVAAGAALQASSLERILSRRTPGKVSLPAAPPDDQTATDVLQLAEPDPVAGLAPPELSLAPPTRPRRPTAGYATTGRRPSEPAKPDTSYSVTRAGVRDQVAEPERYPSAPPLPPPGTGSFETRTPPGASQTQPLGRITRPAGLVTPPQPTPVPSSTPVAANRTMLGVPPAPAEFDIDLSSASPPPRPPASTPPPLPRLPGRPGAVAPATTRIPVIPVIPVVPPLPTVPAVPSAPTVPSASPPLPPKLPASPRPTPPALASPPPASAWDDLPDPGRPAPRASSEEGFGDLDWTASDSELSTDPVAWQADPAPPTRVLGVPRPPAAAQSLVTLASEYETSFTGAQTLIAETPTSPAPAARGFRAPQSYPIQPHPTDTMPRQAPILLEVTPRGLGIATVAGFCEELIRRNSRVPTEIKKLFTTSRDQQDLVRIVVCQGESRRLDNNTIIGDLVLQNLPRRPRGETSIEVTFALDAAGMLHVQARDAHTGIEQRATLDLVGGVAQADVATSRDRLQQLRR